MNLLNTPPLKFCAVLGAALLLLGCKAKSTIAGQEAAIAAPAVTNVLTNTTSQTTITNTVVEKPIAAEIEVSPRLQGIIDMAERGVGDEVLTAYIENSPSVFNLTAAEILYLTDLGFSEPVIAALIKHGNSLKNQAQKPVERTPGPAAAATQSQGTPGTAPASVPISRGSPGDSAPSVVITATPEFEAGPQPPPVTYVLPQPQVQYTSVYGALTPYGSWVEVADYGLCWRPTVAVINPSWKPYCDRGRWLYTDSGWYWQSDYSWGWAPFHYGRWHSHPVSGWVWLPDTTWGPAWVTWRHADSYCGWAPLPPGARFERGFGLRYYGAGVGISFDFGLGRDRYTFVPKSRFYDRTPWKHSLPSSQVVNVYNNSTIVNNYGRGANGTIINEGIGRDHIATHTRSEIRKVTLRDLPADEAKRGIRSERLKGNGTELAVYRPQLPAADLGATRGQEELRKGSRSTANDASIERPSSRSKSTSGASVQSARPGQAEVTTRPPGATIHPIASRAQPSGTVPLVSASPTGTALNDPSTKSRALNPERSNRSAIESRAVKIPAADMSPQTPVTRDDGGAKGPASTVGRNAEITSRPPTVPGVPPAKPAQEFRGAPNTQPQLIQTPVTPIQRRERPQPVSAFSPPVQTGQAPTVENSIPSSAEAMRSNRETRRSTDSSLRPLESRSYTPGASQPAQSTFRSRGIEQPANPASGLGGNPSSYRGTAAPSDINGAATRAYQPSFQAAPQPTSRQELQKPVTVIRPERPGFSQPSPSYPSQSAPSAPSYQPTPPRSAQQYAPPSAQQYSPQTTQPRPPAPSPAPVQVQPRQASPSINSAPPSTSQPSGRSSGGSGGRRQELNKQ